jgi:hypothetical protein
MPGSIIDKPIDQNGPLVTVRIGVSPARENAVRLASRPIPSLNRR